MSLPLIVVTVENCNTYKFLLLLFISFVASVVYFLSEVAPPPVIQTARLSF